jgi:hypothetical protein
MALRLAALAAAVIAAAAAVSAPAGYVPLPHGTVCSRNSALNILPALPRLSFSGKPVSPDLGSYGLATFSGANSSRTMEFYTGFATGPGGFTQASMTSEASRGSVVEYGQVRVCVRRAKRGTPAHSR